jgi:hypothetical protein
VALIISIGKNFASSHASITDSFWAKQLALSEMMASTCIR